MSHSLQEDLLRPNESSSSLTQEEVPLFSGLGDSFASLLNSVGLSSPTAALVNQISGFISSIPEPTNPQPSEYYQALPSGTPTSSNTSSLTPSSSSSTTATGIPRAPLQYYNQNISHSGFGTSSEVSIRAELETSKMELASLRFEFQELKAQMKRFEEDMARLLTLQGLEAGNNQKDDDTDTSELTNRHV
jgi:hypothetical protein